jgi:membrane protein DedA with SNARE-associated domain
VGSWVPEFVGSHGAAAVALLMLLETVFPPIPSELIMTLAGIEAANGRLSLPVAIASGTAGAMLGNYAWYRLACALGSERFRRMVERHGRLLTLRWAEVERADRLFDRWNGWVVSIGRMVPTVRSLVSVPAGLFGMRPLPFLVWSTLGTTGWTAALATGGYLLGRQFGEIERITGPVSSAIMIALAAWYAYRVATWRTEK